MTSLVSATIDQPLQKHELRRHVKGRDEINLQLLSTEPKVVALHLEELLKKFNELAVDRNNSCYTCKYISYNVQDLKENRLKFVPFKKNHFRNYFGMTAVIAIASIVSAIAIHAIFFLALIPLYFAAKERKRLQKASNEKKQLFLVEWRKLDPAIDATYTVTNVKTFEKISFNLRKINSIKNFKFFGLPKSPNRLDPIKVVAVLTGARFADLQAKLN